MYRYFRIVRDVICGYTYWLNGHSNSFQNMRKDIIAEDISRNTRYRILISRKIKISEIEKAPTPMMDNP